MPKWAGLALRPAVGDAGTRRKVSKLIVGFTVFIRTFQAALAEEQGYTAASVDMLWTGPADIASRNLVYGSGGDQGQLRGTMTFIAEDSQGTNPKFEVRDQDGPSGRLSSEWKPARKLCPPVCCGPSATSLIRLRS